jgi:hypothetical protein
MGACRAFLERAQRPEAVRLSLPSATHADFYHALTGNRTPVSTLKEWRPNR